MDDFLPVRIKKFFKHLIGAAEIMGALSLLLWPVRHVVFFLFIWKAISEVYYPAYPLFEWIERGGSYAILLALWIVLKDKEVAAHALSLKSRFTQTQIQKDLFTKPKQIIPFDAMLERPVED